MVCIELSSVNYIGLYERVLPEVGRNILVSVLFISESVYLNTILPEAFFSGEGKELTGYRPQAVSGSLLLIFLLG